VSSPTLVEQFEGFTDARCVAEEDLELSPMLGALGCLDLPQDRVGVAVSLSGHVVLPREYPPPL
jgi:hypothetical protein